MDFLTLSLFIPACFALNMAPGPNNLLAMNNAQNFGYRSAVVAGLGRLSAFVVMIFLAASGLAAILYASETLFFAIKVVGAIYLFWIAYQLWSAKVSDINHKETEAKTVCQLASQEFFLAAGNPKAILIFTAFLPQFIQSTEAVGYQFFILGTLFLCLEFIAIALYAAFGVYLRHWFSKPEMRKVFNRCCAAFLGIIGMGLLVERKS